MRRSTKNLLMYAGMAIAGYYIYTNYFAGGSAATTPNPNQTVAGLGYSPYWRRQRRRQLTYAPGSGGGSSGDGSGANWGNTQDAGSYDPLGVELESEGGYE